MKKKEKIIFDREEVDKAYDLVESYEKAKKLPLPIRIILKMFKIIFWIILTIFLITVFTGFFFYLNALPYIATVKETSYEEILSINNNTFRQLADTVVYGKDGVKIGEINILNYEYVPISEVSDYITDGYIAVEDKTFPSHYGVDYKAVVRAGLSLVKNKGSITQGGSTITQQVLKNNLIDPGINKFKRKILEIIMAPEFEKMYSKAQIMEFYVNTNFYANNIYGVGQASLYYFGKNCKDLTLAEAAVLVGLSNGPSVYDPVRHPDNCLEKRHFVLKRMLEEGKLTQEQFNEADKEELNLVLEKDLRTKESYLMSYAIHDATLKLMEQEGFAFQYTFKTEDEYNGYQDRYSEMYNTIASNIRKGGYTIYTELDPSISEKVQTAVDDNLKTFKEQAVDGRYAVQGAVTVIDNQTGYVVSVVGGRGTEDEYNRAYQAKRQPGSSIKPLLVYGPAFDTGEYYPSLKLNDRKEKDGPGNASGSYNGMTPLRKAIGRSINTIADQLYREVGWEYSMGYLDKLHMNGVSWQDNGTRSLALGGFTYGVNTVDMAKGYATIANYGEYTDKYTVTKIEYQGQGVVYTEKNKVSPVYTEDTAYMLIDCMREAFSDSAGTARGLSIKGLDLAGKTGTTNSKKDGWFCGMSPYYTVAVWVGADQPQRIGKLSGSVYPGHIWKDIMQNIHDLDNDTNEFIAPSTIFEASVNYKGERVSYNSGTKDIFSQIAIDKEEAAEEEAERARKDNYDSELKDELDELIRSFQGYQIKSLYDIPKYDSTYKSLISKAGKFYNDSLESEYKTKIQTEYNNRNREPDVEEYRAAYNKYLEEQAKREAEEREQRRLEAIEQAEAAVTALEQVNIYSDFENLLANAKSAVSKLEEFGLSESYQSRIEQMEYYYNTYIKPPAVIETPEVTENPDEVENGNTSDNTPDNENTDINDRVN